MSGEAAGVLLQYGAVGVMLVIVGLLARSLIAREQVRSDRLDAEVTRLNGIIQEKVIPALTVATQAVLDSQRLLQTLQYQRDVEQQARKPEPRTPRREGGATR